MLCALAHGSCAWFMSLVLRANPEVFDVVVVPRVTDDAHRLCLASAGHLTACLMNRVGLYGFVGGVRVEPVGPANQSR